MSRRGWEVRVGKGMEMNGGGDGWGGGGGNVLVLAMGLTDDRGPLIDHLIKRGRLTPPDTMDLIGT